MDRNQFIEDMSEILEEDPKSISLQTRLDDLENWDSLNVLMVITHVDEHFGVELPIQELSSCQRISDLCDLVENAA